MSRDTTQRERSRPPRSARNAALQAAQRRWVEALANDRQLTKSALAKGADLQPSTLTRLFSDGYTGLLSQAVIDQLATTYQVPAPVVTSDEDAPRVAFGDAETLDFSDTAPSLARMVRAAIDGHNAVDPWVMRSDALEAAGILAGDIMLVDLNARPEPGDACCLQLLDPYPALRGRTIWRVFQDGFYVAARFARLQAEAPIAAGSPGLVLRGVVVGSIRPHRLSHHIT